MRTSKFGGRVCIDCRKVFSLQIGKFRKNFLLGHPASKIFENIFDRNAQIAYTSLS